MIATVDDLRDEIDAVEAEAEAASVLAGITAERGLAGDREKDAVHQRELADKLTALLIRRQTNQHGCAGANCDHPDHARDVDYCNTMLDMLGLSRRYPVVTKEDRDEFVGSVAMRIPRHNRPPGGKPRWNNSIK